MAEYIDKQDAIDIFKQFKKRKWISMPIEQVIEIISVVPYVESEPQRAYDQGVKDALDRYDEACRIASDIRTAMGCKTAKECRELISNGEIQRVKHRKWKQIVHPWYECSECGERTAVVNLNGEVAWHYCPNCGAKMDEVEE